MTNITNPTTLFHPITTTTTRHHRNHIPPIRATLPGHEPHSLTRRLLIATSISLLGLNTFNSHVALAENWGTRSFIKERFFEPGLSPEDAVARIKQTREGLHSIRNMLETMSWRYVLFYIRLKAAYLSQDLKDAMSIVPDTMKSSYVKVANELVDNMAEVSVKHSKHQMAETNEVNSMPSKEQEEAVIKKKYGGLLPKKNPLISKDHDWAFFDSADWALGKQGQKSKGPLEALRPKLQPTPQQ